METEIAKQQEEYRQFQILMEKQKAEALEKVKLQEQVVHQIEAEMHSRTLKEQENEARKDEAMQI